MVQRYNAQGEIDDNGEFVLFDDMQTAVDFWKEQYADLQMRYGIELTERDARIDRLKKDAIKYQTLKDIFSDLTN